MAHRPTTEELALHILKRVYEHTEGRSAEHWRNLAKAAEAGAGASASDGTSIVCRKPPPFPPGNA